MDLQRKTVVITGAAQGLGQKIAEIVAGQGANVALVDLDHMKLQDTVGLCSRAGGKAKDYPIDVTDESAVETLFNNVHRDPAHEGIPSTERVLDCSPIRGAEFPVD